MYRKGVRRSLSIVLGEFQDVTDWVHCITYRWISIHELTYRNSCTEAEGKGEGKGLGREDKHREEEDKTTCASGRNTYMSGKHHMIHRLDGKRQV